MTGTPHPRPYYGEWESCDGHFEATVNVTPGDDVWPTMVGFELSDRSARIIGGTLTTDDARDLANHMLAAAALADLENRERAALRVGSPRGEESDTASAACAAPSSPDGAPPKTCLACGMDLTPTPEQIRALERFGNPLRRQPCLETEDGFHQVLFGGGSLGAPGKDTAGA